MIKEAELKLNEIEKKIHNLLKDISDKDIISYLFKRMQFAEITDEEKQHLYNIYESGTTTFSFKLFDKPHKMRLLKQKEKLEINSVIDNLFNSKENKLKFTYHTEEEKFNAYQTYKMLGVVALSVISIDDDEISDILEKKGVMDNLLNRISLFEEMSNILIQTLFNKYTEFENRIMTLFEFESIRKN